MSEIGLSRWNTWQEIHGQPAIWRDWAGAFDAPQVRQWVRQHAPEEIWFCGSGTSAYIGDIIAAGLEGQRGGPRLRAVAATDLVARPGAFLSGRKPLVVNFGRSGNSAETLGTLDALDALAPDAPRLNITCNAESQLASRSRDQDHLIVLPAATHDSGFAMTSSFSTMLFTALMVVEQGASADHLRRAADICESLLGTLPAITGAAPERLAFVGSGALTYAARESALKVMELSAGRIPCLWDSILGFRHGPKSFVDAGTQVVVLTGYDTETARYEADLINELRLQFPETRLTTLGPGGDIDLPQPDGPLWAGPNAVLFSQVAGSMWADQAGLDVDFPFKGQGTLTRVVADVKLYEVAP